VYRSQPVITGEGVIGQVFRIGPFSSEIILITDAEHALPVQVLRSGVRTIALGTGRSTALELPYVPQNYDVKVGDVLVTSGLGQVFPYGLPVARVTRVERDPAQPLAQIHAVPLAHVDSDREVLFIWERPGHPAAPATAEALAVTPPKTEATQPAAPKPKPKPATRPAAAKPADINPGTPGPEAASPATPNPEKPVPETPAPAAPDPGPSTTEAPAT
jgi:rod shape-determining protein MreC